MSEVITILDKQIDQMAKVFNVVPGDLFRFKDTDTLLIVQRKLEDSDLKTALSFYNEIFARTDGVDLDDLCKSAIAYVKVKTLVENGTTHFDGRTTRALIKEFKSQIVKINNIIHLSTVNAMAAEPYQKEEIKKTLVKNQAFLEAFEKEIVKLEKLIERMPKEEPEQDLQTDIKKDLKKSGATKNESKEKKDSVFSKFNSVIKKRQEQKHIDSRLKTEEKKKSQTACVEVPFYDKSLVFTEVYECKDISLYVLVKRKNNVFFGLKKNLGKSSYDNSDHSLIELTEATDDFVQYMTVDLLSGDYKLKPFTNEEKKSMRMYFNFMSWCFEHFLGTSLSVQEYLKFKNYYNKVVLTMFELEEKFRSDYYRALVLADNYVTYMECYDLSYSDEKKLIVKNIMNEKSRNYISDLELIMEHHVVLDSAKDDIAECIQKIKFFDDEKVFEVEQPKEIMSNRINVTGYIEENSNPVPEYFDMKDYNNAIGVTAEDLSYIQIKIQFLNKEHVIMDEALFSVANIKKAVFDYLNRKAYIKKIGLFMNEKEVFLYSSKNGSISVLVLNEDMRRVKKLDKGIQGQLVDFYEEKIRKTMVEMTN